MEYQTNDRVYFVRSHRIVTEASVLGRSYGFYIIRFVGNTGIAAICVRKSRLFSSEEDARTSAGLPAARKYPRSPHLMHFN